MATQFETEFTDREIDWLNAQAKETPVTDTETTTTVIHISKAPKGWESDPNYVYIGRNGKGQTSIWGNPFRHDATHTRAWAVAQYRKLLWSHLQDRATGDEWLTQLRALHGKTLICFCKPNICHGDVLAAAAEWAETGGWLTATETESTTFVRTEWCTPWCGRSQFEDWLHTPKCEADYQAAMAAYDAALDQKADSCWGTPHCVPGNLCPTCWRDAPKAK